MLDTLHSLLMEAFSAVSGPLLLSPQLEAGMIGAPLVLLAVLWAGRACLPEGTQLNAAGWVMLTGTGLLLSLAAAVIFAGPAGLHGWNAPPGARQSARLLGVMGGTAALAGGILWRGGPREPLVRLSAGGVLAGAGALVLKCIEVVTVIDPDHAAASLAAPLGQVAMWIAGIYLLGALVVALTLPRRAAPLSAVLLLLALLALVSGWSPPSPDGSSGRGLLDPLLGHALHPQTSAPQDAERRGSDDTAAAGGQ